MIAGIYPNLDKKRIYDILPLLIRILEKNHISYILPEDFCDMLSTHHIQIPEKCFVPLMKLGQTDIVFSIGGDGTFLGAARIFRDSPVKLVGIHAGELGFLNSIEENTLEKRIDQIIQGDYEIEKRLFLHSEIVRTDTSIIKSASALNDVVVGHNNLGEMARICLSVNHHFVNEYPADALLISTATGSTGYSLSCGGPILYPDSKELLVTPICAHSVNHYPVILKENDEVEITMPERQKELHISFDGGRPVKLSFPDILRITGETKKISFIRFKDQNFFSSFSSKMISKICDK